jgi:ferredoxin
MAMRILEEQCACCGLCSELCPVSAIRRPSPTNGLATHEINASRCTECVGHFGWPSCASYCRMNAIVFDRKHFESRTTLLRKWHQVAGAADYTEDPPDGLAAAQEFGDSDA